MTYTQMGYVVGCVLIFCSFVAALASFRIYGMSDLSTIFRFQCLICCGVGAACLLLARLQP